MCILGKVRWYHHQAQEYLMAQIQRTFISISGQWAAFFFLSFSRAINSGFLCLKIFIGIWLIHNVVLVTGVQKSTSIIYIHISTLFQILFLHRPLQSIEQSSLCYTVGPHQLSILYIIVCICQSQSLNLSLPLLTPQ